MNARRAARALGTAAAFWAGVAVGLVVEQRRGFGSDHWRSEAQLAWHMREVVGGGGGGSYDDGGLHAVDGTDS